MSFKEFIKKWEKTGASERELSPKTRCNMSW